MHEKKDQTRLWYGPTEKSTVLFKGKFEAVSLTFLISSKSTAFVQPFRSADLDSFHSSHHSGLLSAGPDYRSAEQWPADRQTGLIRHHSTGADRLEPAAKSNLRSFTAAVRSLTARRRACSVRRAQRQFDRQSVSPSFGASIFVRNANAGRIDLQVEWLARFCVSKAERPRIHFKSEMASEFYALCTQIDGLIEVRKLSYNKRVWFQVPKANWRSASTYR